MGNWWRDRAVVGVAIWYGQWSHMVWFGSWGNGTIDHLLLPFTESMRPVNGADQPAATVDHPLQNARLRRSVASDGSPHSSLPAVQERQRLATEGEKSIEL